MIDLDYWKEVHGVEMVMFDGIVAEAIGYDLSSSQSDEWCLLHELQALALEAIERRYRIQQRLNKCTGDASATLSLQSKLEKAESDMQRYELLVDSAKKLIAPVESEISKGKDCGFEYEVDDEIDALYVSRAGYERWLERKKEVEAAAKITSVSVAAAKTPAKRDKMTRQENRIEETRRALYDDPSKEPMHSPRSSGVKAAVRNALKNDPLFAGKTTFEKAWERVSKNKAVPAK